MLNCHTRFLLFCFLLVVLQAPAFAQQTAARKEVGLGFTGLNFNSSNAFSAFYKKEIKENVYRRLIFFLGNIGLLNTSSDQTRFDASIGFGIGREKRKALDEKLWFYRGPQWTLNTFLQVATNNRQTTSNTYNLNAGIGYILGLQHNLNDRWAINLETIPTFSIGYQWDNRSGSESESFSANVFLSNTVRVGIVRRF